jgi:ankyrin repeat protein
MKNYYDKYKDMPLETLEYEVLQACEIGDLEAVKYLLTSNELRINPSPQCSSNTGLHNACENGYLEIVKYLLTSPDLKEHADIHSSDNWALQGACYYNHFEIIKYLLTSPDLKEHANIYATDCQVFKDACINADEGDYSIVDYLLQSPDLDNHIDIHFNDDMFFKDAVTNGQIELIQHFIFNFDFEKTKDIENFLKRVSLEGIDKLFEIKETNKELKIELNLDNQAQNRKLKL